MKLLVCLFLIIMVIEQYNCAPHIRTRHRHKHHHNFQIGRSRQRSPCRYVPRFKHNYGYQPMCDMYHPWRHNHHCHWQGYRHSSRHCSGYGYQHGYGQRHDFRSYYGHGSQYGFKHGENNFIPNTTPMYNTEDTLSTVEPLIDNVIATTSEGSVYESTEKTIVTSSEQPVEAVTGIPPHRPTEVPVEVVTVTAEDKTTGTLVEEVAENQTQMLEVEPTEKTTEMPVDQSVEQSTLGITVAADDPVTVSQDIPQYLTSTMTYEELLEQVFGSPTTDESENLIFELDLLTESPF